MNCLHKLTLWYFKKKALPYWCILTFDCLTVIVAYLLSFYVLIGGTYFIREFWTKLGYITFLVVPLYLVGFKYTTHTQTSYVTHRLPT